MSYSLYPGGLALFLWLISLDVVSALCSKCQLCSNDNCLTCVPFSRLVSSSGCECDEGYHWDGHICSVCDRTCRSCSDLKPTDCLSCFSNANLICTGPNACKCISELAENNTARKNADCNVSCSTCVNPLSSKCTSCYPNAYLSGAAPSSCVCVAGYFPSPTAGDCTPCPNSCLTCTNSYLNSCLSCKPNAALAGSSPNLCLCDAGFFPNPTAGDCVVCDSSCATCIGNLPSQCLTCKSYAFISSPAPTNCVCIPGYFPDITSANCSACHSSCLTCSSSTPSSCLSCPANSQLLNPSPNLCDCLPGYYPNPGVNNCTACHPICKTCTGAGKTNCATFKVDRSMDADDRDGGESTSTCINGSYWDSDQANCVACNVECQTCQGGTNTDCLTCKDGAQPILNACICISGLFPNPDASNCSVCNPTCLTCSGPSGSNCQTCKAHSSLSVSVPNTCVCDLRFFLNPDSSACMQCDPTCLTCTEAMNTSCASCYSDAVIEGGILAGGASTLGKCICATGFFENFTAASCSPCHSLCNTCVDATQNGCTSCRNNMVLSEVAPNECMCLPGYFLNPQSTTCEFCHSSCTSCSKSGESGCLTCHLNALLNSAPPSICVCNSGYYMNSITYECELCDSSFGNCLQCNIGFYPSPTVGECKACMDHCSMCRTSDVCIGCDAGFFLSDTTCVQCAEGCSECVTLEKCTACIALYALTLTSKCVSCPNCGQPLRASVSSPFDHKYQIGFNHNISVIFAESDFLIATDPVSEMAWSIFSNSPLLISIRGGPWNKSTTFHIVFLHPEYIFDDFGSVLTTKTLDTSPPIGSILPNITTSVLISQDQTFPQMFQKSTNVIASSAIISGALLGSSAAVGLAIRIQYLSFLSKTNVSLPDEMGGMYSEMNQKSIIPNLFSKDYTGADRRRALQSGDFFDFLQEAGSFISIFSILVCVHTVVRILVFPKRNNLPKGMKWLVNKLEWSLYLDFVGFAYLDLTLNSLTQMNKISFPLAGARSISNFSVSLLVLLVISLFPIYVFFLIKSHRSQLFDSESITVVPNSDNTFKRKWINLIDGLRDDIRFAQYYQPACYVQRFIYAIFLVFVDPGKWLCLLLIFPSLWMTLFVIFFRPMDTVSQRYLLILSEAQNLFVFIAIFLMELLTDQRSALGWAVVLLSLGSLACGFIMFVFDIYDRVVSFIKSRKCFNRHSAEVSNAQVYEINNTVGEEQSPVAISMKSLYPNMNDASLWDSKTAGLDSSGIFVRSSKYVLGERTLTE